MPLPQTYRHGVVFIGRVPHGKPPQIAGTGFLVGVDDESPVMKHTYLVTAAHVVEGSDPTFVQIPDREGNVHTADVPDWIFHGEHDVAVAPINVGPNAAVIFTGTSQFIDSPTVPSDRFGPIELGDPIYFIGLLGNIEAMVERNIPIVRTGFLGALWQEGVPVKRTRHDATKFITAHLIDCRSFAGFSGSPCYLQKTRVTVFPDKGLSMGWRVRGNEAEFAADQSGPTVGLEWATVLCGLIGGHFDDWTGTQQIVSTGEQNVYSVSDDIRAPVSTGVGYVIPAEFIRETLMREELVEMRRDEEEKALAEKERKRDDDAATMDSAVQDESEFERFEDLTRKVLNTPKAKPDEEKS